MSYIDPKVRTKKLKQALKQIEDRTQKLIADSDSSGPTDVLLAQSVSGILAVSLNQNSVLERIVDMIDELYRAR